MTREQALVVVAQALGVVLETDPAGLRADTLLASLGVDSLVLVGTADVVEATIARQHDLAIRLDDNALAAAVTVADLVRHLIDVSPADTLPPDALPPDTRPTGVTL